jgi:hypothetical protein
VNLTLQLLLAGLLGASLLAAGLLAGAAVAGRPLRMTERRLDRALAIEAARSDRYLNLLLARDPLALQFMQATSPAQPPEPDRLLAGPPEPRPPWETGEFNPDVNEVNEWDEVDDAALRRLGH